MFNRRRFFAKSAVAAILSSAIGKFSISKAAEVKVEEIKVEEIIVVKSNIPHCVVKSSQKKYLICTPNHLIFTPDGWKKAEELKIGDFLNDGLIVDPVDDFVLNNRPVSPELLDTLASQFFGGTQGRKVQHLYSKE